ncbi:hypothetical protein [Metallibacterium scheffleri]
MPRTLRTALRASMLRTCSTALALSADAWAGASSSASVQANAAPARRHALRDGMGSDMAHLPGKNRER